MTVADSASFADESAKTGGLDIQRVCVINASRLTVRATVDDYRHTFSEDEASLWVDTHPRRPGPEFFMGSGLYERDWQIVRTRGWRIVGRRPLNCPVKQLLDPAREVMNWTTGPACLGSYSRVRVSVTTGPANGTTDHSPAYHRLHRWVTRY